MDVNRKRNADYKILTIFKFLQSSAVNLMTKNIYDVLSNVKFKFTSQPVRKCNAAEP